MEQIFDAAVLRERAAAHRALYAANEPFPHVVIDDFLAPEIAEGLLNAFPEPGTRAWTRFDADHEVKLQLSDEGVMNPFVRDVIAQLNGATFIDFLERLTDIDGLIPDPHLLGGGLHQIEPGGYLDVHADFNYHPRLRLDRRLNLLLYLNREWLDDYNGHLELWDTAMSGCQRRIAPLFNRCVIFTTTDFSYHGHPDPLRCPQGRTRKSLALYYYSNGRPAHEIASGEQADGHSTLFRARPGEHIRDKSSRSRRLKRTMRRLVPPIVVDMINVARGRH